MESDENVHSSVVAEDVVMSGIDGSEGEVVEEDEKGGDGGVEDSVEGGVGSVKGGVGEGGGIEKEGVSPDFSCSFGRVVHDVSSTLTFVCPESVDERKRLFQYLIANIDLTYYEVGGLYVHGSWAIVILAYFILYQCLVSLNRKREHFEIHRLVVRMLNDSSSGNFNTVFDLLFS